MWIPKNPPGGLPVKIAVALGSLALLHMAFIVVHTLLDDTSPNDTFIYPFDRAVEAVELQWSLLWGHDAEVEARLHSATERIDEAEPLFEEVAHTDQPDTKTLHTLQMLLNDALVQIDLATVAAQTEAYAHLEDVDDFALAIYVQSSLEDIVLRTRKALRSVEHHQLVAGMAENFLLTSQSYLDVSNTVVAAFQISEDIETTIREEVSQQFIGSVIVQPSEELNTCARKDEQCATSADCCGDTGLTCMPFQSSAGFTRRCQKVAHSICEVVCEETGTWGKPRRCQAGYIEEETHFCATLSAERCASGAVESCWKR